MTWMEELLCREEQESTQTKEASPLTITLEKITYKPWEVMSDREKAICIVEVVLGYERYIDLDKCMVSWIKPGTHVKVRAVREWPPDYPNDSNAMQEIKRKFDGWTITKLAPRHYLATVVTESGLVAQASGISENDAFLHACVIAMGVCV